MISIPLHELVGMALQISTLVVILGIAWRAAAWKSRVDDRLQALEDAVKNKIKKRWWF